MTHSIEVMETMHNDNITGRLQDMAERLSRRHPYLSFFAAFIGVPIFMVAAVGIFTALALLPISLFLGWF